MYTATTKRLTSAGARKMLSTAIGIAEQAGVPITVAIADAGGHLVLLERMEGGFPIIFDGECVGGIGVSGGDWTFDERVAREALEAIGASFKIDNK